MTSLILVSEPRHATERCVGVSRNGRAPRNPKGYVGIIGGLRDSNP